MITELFVILGNNSLDTINTDLAVEFMTTSKSKQDMIEQMMVANQNKEFTILSNPEIKKEFNLFTYEYNPKTRNVKYSAPSGFHDDIVMSTAIAFQSYKINKIKGVGFTLR